MPKDIKILITGINGFIGSNLEAYVRRKYPSWQIYGVDNKLKESKRRFKIDLTENSGELEILLSRIRPRYIFHFAGIVSNDNFKKLLELNILTTYNLFSTVQEIKGYSPRIIIPSSASEYGRMSNSQLPADEDCPPRPVNIYGFSKMIQTQLSLMFKEDGLDIVIARIFNILGKGISKNFAMGKFAKELALIKEKKQKPVLVTKSLETKRDFLDIRDVCKCILAITLFGKRGEVYNVCRGKSFLMTDLLTKLIRIADVSGIKIIEDNKRGSFGEISDSFGSTVKLKKILKDFKPISIEKSLKNTFFNN